MKPRLILSVIALVGALGAGAVSIPSSTWAVGQTAASRPQDCYQLRLQTLHPPAQNDSSVLRYAFQIEGEQGRPDCSIRVSWTQLPAEPGAPASYRSREYNSWIAAANSQVPGEVANLEAVVQPRTRKSDLPFDRSSRAKAENCYFRGEDCTAHDGDEQMYAD
ncbi:hypothetical protein [Streptomyces sp. NPDC048111]|uniref:hypothetical protein n=1 Tax=Streptomyces sp. NPDC048111 TaxID=3365500 RepID=UPI00371C30B0